VIRHILAPLGAHKVSRIQGILPRIGNESGPQSNAQWSSRPAWQANKHRTHSRQIVKCGLYGYHHNARALASCGVVHHRLRVTSRLLLEKKRLAGALSHGTGRGGGGGRLRTVHIKAVRGQKDLGEWTLGQVQHLDHMLSSSSSQIRCLLHLPHDHADGEEEEKAGEEH